VPCRPPSACHLATPFTHPHSSLLPPLLPLPAQVPGLLRLGLAAASPPRANPGFKFERSLKGDLLPFDKSQPAAGGGGAEAAAAEPGPARGSSDPFVPAKFALAGQRLTFRCYYQEGVPESALETSRKRHLVLLYHLEDDTAEIVEPEVRNNGLIPGRFLKRMRLPDISPETLRVGAVVEIYARTFKLYACDDFTRVSRCGGAAGSRVARQQRSTCSE
jgi:hypothetical protein